MPIPTDWTTARPDDLLVAVVSACQGNAYQALRSDKAPTEKQLADTRDWEDAVRQLAQRIRNR